MNLANDIAAHVTPVLVEQGTEFIKQSAPDAGLLTSDQLRAVWNSALFQEIAIPNLPDDPTPMQVLEVEKLIALNDHYILVISQAELIDAEAIKRTKSRALKMVQTVGATIAAAGLIAAKNALQGPVIQ